MSKETFIRKDDPKYIDLLDEDNPVAGQKFVCLSFVSPEKIIKQREEYLFEKFVEQWQFSKEVESDDEDGVGEGGYAKETSDDYKQKQHHRITDLRGGM